MIRALITAFVALAFAGAAHAQIPGARQHVQAELVSSRVAVAPGERFVVALRQVIEPGWHTYWINPGDSGIATTLKWDLPSGFAAGEIEWPAPEAIEIEGLVNYGFGGEVLFPVELTAPKNSGPATLRARADWLACADVCIPESADLVLNIDVGSASRADETWAPRLSAARAALPQPANLETNIGKTGDHWALTVRGGALSAFLSAGEIRAPYYFPLAGDAIDHAAKQEPRIGSDAIVFALTPAPGADLATKPLDGVVTLEVKEAGAWVKRAFVIGAATAGAPPADIGAPSGAGELGIAAALLFALLGGLILNVMPCVFPVLSIKALSLAKAEDEGVARRDGLLFLAGVMTTFLALAGALIALQAAGAQIGWGFQLQEPWVVSLLALLFFAIGLNLLGAYEIGAGVQNVGSSLAAKGGGAGAFFTGALAVIAATPCTAPFMGAAMGFAATQPPALSLLVFATLGLGFAAPFVALSLVPQLRRWLPKPGAWMETFKQFLAFPMFAAAIWLVWVLNEQTGAGTVLLLLSAFLAFGFAVWALRTLRNRVMRYGAVAVVAFVVLSAIFVGVQQRPAQASSAAADGLAGPLAYEAWSPEREAQLIGEGKAVFVNFTAAWCVTCQVNEKVALQTREVADAFAAQNVTYLKADWTARDSVIAQALKKHGRAGVPLYLFYPAGAGSAPPKVLPQILTPGLVLEAIGENSIGETKE